MKISTIIENMKKYHKGYGTIDEEKTRDKVLYGNVDQECTGIVTSCWASVDVIEYAIEKGANLISVMKHYFGIMEIIKNG